MDIKLFEIRSGTPYYEGEKLTITLNSQGYCYVTILRKRNRLHRLVAKRYIPNPDEYKVVHHLNHNKQDNRVENLEWKSHSDNSILSCMANPQQTYFKIRKVKATHKDGTVKVFESARECARELNRDIAAVVRCLQGEWTYCNNHRLQHIEP